MARLAGFHERLVEADHPLAINFTHAAARARDPRRPRTWDECAARWMTDVLPRTGILVQDSNYAQTLTLHCRRLGIAVPERLAVFSADDDVFLCEAFFPTISGVRLPGGAIGTRAAALAIELLASAPGVDQDMLIPPLGITVRASPDPAVAAARRLLAERCRQDVSGRELCAAAGLNRRTFERRFRRLVGRGPMAELRRLHLERAMDLLHGSAQDLAAIAVQTGYASADALAAALRRATGLAPGRRAIRHSGTGWTPLTRR